MKGCVAEFILHQEKYLTGMLCKTCIDNRPCFFNFPGRQKQGQKRRSRTLLQSGAKQINDQLVHIEIVRKIEKDVPLNSLNLLMANAGEIRGRIDLRHCSSCQVSPIIAIGDHHRLHEPWP